MNYNVILPISETISFHLYLSGYYSPVSDFFIATIQIGGHSTSMLHTSGSVGSPLVCNLYTEGEGGGGGGGEEGEREGGEEGVRAGRRGGE